MSLTDAEPRIAAYQVQTKLSRQNAIVTALFASGVAVVTLAWVSLLIRGVIWLARG